MSTPNNVLLTNAILQIFADWKFGIKWLNFGAKTGKTGKIYKTGGPILHAQKSVLFRLKSVRKACKSVRFQKTFFTFFYLK